MLRHDDNAKKEESAVHQLKFDGARLYWQESAELPWVELDISYANTTAQEVFLEPWDVRDVEITQQGIRLSQYGANYHAEETKTKDIEYLTFNANYG